MKLILFFTICWVVGNLSEADIPSPIKIKALVDRQLINWKSKSCAEGDVELRCEMNYKKYKCPDFSADMSLYVIATLDDGNFRNTSVKYCKQKKEHPLPDEKGNNSMRMQKEFRESKCNADSIEIVCNNGAPSQMVMPKNEKCDHLDKSFKKVYSIIEIGSNPGVTITRYCKKKGAG